MTNEQLLEETIYFCFVVKYDIQDADDTFNAF